MTTAQDQEGTEHRPAHPRHPLYTAHTAANGVVLCGVLILPVLLLVLGTGSQPAAGCLPATATPTTEITGGGEHLDDEQLRVAARIVAATQAFPPTADKPHAAVIALATARQESGLRNLHYGDRDSLGVFQQRPSQGWGTPAQILDVGHATTTFLEHLIATPDWETRPVTDVAADVQHPAPAYRDRYQQWVPLATELTSRLWPTSLDDAYAVQPDASRPVHTTVPPPSRRTTSPSTISPTTTSTNQPTSQPTDQPTDQPGIGTVLVHQANIYTGETAAQFQVDLGEVLAGSPDFATLNEVYRRTDAELRPTGYDAWRADTPRDARDTAVLWRTDRWTPVATGTLRMHHRPVRWGTRYVNWVTLRPVASSDGPETDGPMVSVISGHASPAGPGRSGLFDQFMDNTVGLIRGLSTRGPVLFGGDLNVQYPYRRPDLAAAFEQRLAAAGARTTFGVLGEPVGGWATGNHYGATIDYLIAAGATPTGHATVPLTYSDHRMVTAHFQLDVVLEPWCPPETQTTDGTVVYPVPVDLADTNQDNWGHQGSKWGSWHTGTDFAVPCGTPVLAATGGTIEIEPGPAWYGSWLVKVVTGPTSVATWYAHLRQVAVRSGQVVSAGQLLGEVGDLGNATGCHLHFEVHLVNGPIYGPDNVDPTAWLMAHVAAAPHVALSTADSPIRRRPARSGYARQSPS